MSGVLAAGFFPNAAPFFDVPDVRLRILCLPLGEGAGRADEVGTNF